MPTRLMTYPILALLMLAGSTGAHAQEPGYEYAQLGEHRIAYLCRGQGDLTVLLISGMGLSAYETFRNTFNRATPTQYQLCLYDRAGTGASVVDNPKPRPMLALVEELEALTTALGIEEVILAPHSFGGLIAKAFAHRHPERVKGIVFIDAAHESWYADLKKSMSPEGWAIMESIIEWEREVHSFEDFEEAAVYPDYAITRDLPITVLARGIPHVSIRSAGISYVDVDAYTVTWNRSQVAQTKTTDDVEWAVMRYASHLFDGTDPWIVIEHLEKMVARVRASATRVD